ncbi:hypothetical protein SMACR_08493 [Sordaria macrospora]|uniref:NAD(P)H-hydrate epimerase n=1 Tax=Sordaria macrospora TaxID=5147 RepID=A0A8S8ZNB9_SORMA|nr:hypothetical protein SMACR_08493 [Sordaria macrospora]
MALKTLSAKAAATLDRELMSTGAFSLDQLMELAGLSVSQVVARVHPIKQGRRVLVAVGPGNNGGDGLVAARHLFHYGYQPAIYYPKRPKNELYQVSGSHLFPSMRCAGCSVNVDSASRQASKGIQAGRDRSQDKSSKRPRTFDGNTHGDEKQDQKVYWARAQSFLGAILVVHTISVSPYPTRQTLLLHA